MKRSAFSYFIAACLCACFVATHAYAADYGLAPSSPDIRNKETFSSFKYTIIQGASVTDTVDIINTGNQTLNLYLLSDKGTAPRDYIVTQALPISVSINKRTSVQFTIKIPKTIKDGEYVSYLYLGSKNNAPLTKATPSLPVILTIGKKQIKQLTIASQTYQFGPHGATLTTQIKNTGTTTINSLGIRLQLKNLLPLINSPAEYYWGENKKIGPKEVVQFIYKVPQNVAIFNNYQAQLTVEYGAKTNYTKTFNVFYFDKTTALIYLGVLLGVVIALSFILKHARIEPSKLKIYLTRFITRSNPFPKIPKLQPYLDEQPPQAQPKHPETPTQSTIKEVGLEGLIKNIMNEEESLIASKELSYDKIFFEVRKIVRQEIELWKEMERFRTQIRERLTLEELKTKKHSEK